MSKFKNAEKKGQPAVSTAALPDIVFMLLFFFMVAASIKTDNYTQFIKLKKPKATELTKLEKKDLIPNIYVGKPNEKYQSQYGKSYILVVNDKPSTTLNVIQPYLRDFLEGVDGEERKDVVPQLTIDKDASMGLVDDIKREIGMARIFNVSYGADQGSIEENIQ